MGRLGYGVTPGLVELYKDFVDWVFEGKDRTKYDWTFCTYMDGEPYIHLLGMYISHSEFLRAKSKK